MQGGLMAGDDTSENDTSIDELSQRIQQLSSADRADLLESVRGDQLSSYLDARGEYIDNLREEGLMPGYPEGPWSDYCREHPEDPICQRIVTGEQQRQRLEAYQRARGQFVDRLREQGLLSEDEGGGPTGLEPMAGLDSTMATTGASSVEGLGGASGLGRASDLPGFDSRHGYTPDPSDPWPWPDFCMLYPWFCGNWPTPDPFPFPDPIPRPGPRPDPVPFARGEARTPMSSRNRLFSGQGVGLPAIPDRPERVPDRIPDDRFPPRDICELAPWLPQCDGRRCPPICYYQPSNPICWGCWF
ncbi:hypothetical protein [Halorussus sp. MSC15.2]|uniref:hypothetical protein n=1 Tax=Halorussus sp. MSC15.2 TaxID=2283638 RepID=UPI0013D3922C|nr:hypothetical protein [Halorussus sp. MSC15.2]NEU57571.1 hypothetical protein [Halorussus sp. MSC15.2]